MKKGGYITQQRIREENRNKILSLLHEGPNRFSELEVLTGFSPAGLANILEELLQQKKIIKIVKDGKLAYSIKKGTRLGEIFFLGRVAYEIKERGGNSYIDYSHSKEDSIIDNEPWGIESHLVLDKDLEQKTFNPFSEKDVLSIEQDIFKLIRNKIGKKKLKIGEKQKGTILLGFRIDYPEIISSIKHTSPIGGKKGGKR